MPGIVEVDDQPTAAEMLTEYEAEIERLRNGGENCPWMNREESIKYLEECILHLKETR